ncbi:MAG: hypothetical protein NT070_01040 [Cyanobacteria bacterium]|nr:hypothetical protein [Cyanobacteriota bacterium]
MSSASIKTDIQHYIQKLDYHSHERDRHWLVVCNVFVIFGFIVGILTI